MKIISIECPKCKGTGLYIGLAERNGAAVVCHGCRGSGRTEFRFNKFTGRKDKPGVKRVYQVNPGICIGTGNGHTLAEFGGMPASDWADGKSFPPGSENRAFTCPAWWYQSANYAKRPDWKECQNWGASFSDCKHFCDKAKCWERYDKESALEAERRESEAEDQRRADRYRFEMAERKREDDDRWARIMGRRI